MLLPFDPNAADLNGIANGAELYVSTVIHEAWLKFSEEGTEAAAATAAVFLAAAVPV